MSPCLASLLQGRILSAVFSKGKSFLTPLLYDRVVTPEPVGQVVGITTKPPVFSLARGAQVYILSAHRRDERG